MRLGTYTRFGAARVAPGLLALAFAPAAVSADEPGRLARFFRFNGSAATSRPAPLPGVKPGAGFMPADVPPTPPTTAAGQPQPRLIPQPRVARSVTDADPLVTRVAVGRTSEGAQFAMFMQVYADGTVIDSEGVHPLGRDAVKPVLEALDSGELYRLKGHCGGPPTDFVEHVQVVVYERNMRGLRANAFSFSGNPQGCDHAVRHLQTVLDNLQTKLSRPASRPGTAAGPTPTTHAPAGLLTPPPVLSPDAPTIRLNDGADPAVP